MTNSEATNTSKSIKNNNGFIIRRFGSQTTYLKSTGNGKTIWVARINPTILFGKKTDTWGVYILDDVDMCEMEANALGFKTHNDAEKWANNNI